MADRVTQLGLTATPARATSGDLRFRIKRGTDRLTQLGLTATPALQYRPFDAKSPAGVGRVLVSSLLTSRIIT